ncbi:MAG: PAS domain S-box protein [Rubrobacter sp.]|nr:PAS domain S-box protein [Rubrobacter sp.]
MAAREFEDVPEVSDLLVRKRSRAARYGVAMAAVGAALLVELLLLAPLVGDQDPFAPFVLLSIAVMAGALFGGLGPGLLSTVLGALVGDYFFVLPQGSFTPDNFGEGSRLLLFVAEGILISVLAGAIHRKNQQAGAALEALRLSEQRSRLLAEEARDYAAFTLDVDGTVTAWNARQFGGYGEGLIGERFSLFYAAEDVERGLPEEELRAATENVRHEGEGWRVREDGSRFWASVAITALKDEAGNPSGFSVAMRDATERKRIEEGLRIRELAIAASSNGVVATDPTRPDNPITYANPAFERMTGYSAEEIVGRNCRFLQGEDRDQPAVRELSEAIREGRYLTVILRNYKKDGTPFWNELSISPVYDEEGGLTRYVGVQNDVTERIRIEEDLRRSEERYRSFVEHSEEGIWRLELEHPLPTGLPEDEQIEHLYRHGRLAECNRAMARMYGFERANGLIGASLETLLPRSVPENVEHLRAFIGSGYRLDGHRSLGIDGRGETQRFLDNLTGVVENGLLAQAWGIRRDDTERERAEDALRKSEERYRSTVEQAVEGIFMVDSESLRVLMTNAAFRRLLGYDEEEISRMKLPDFVAHDRESIDARVRRTLEEGIYSIGERRYRRKDGTLVDVEVSASAVSYAGRTALCCVAHDVTGRRQREEALRESEERFRAAFEQAAVGMAHVSLLSRWLKVNDRLCEILGYTEEELLQLGFQEIVHPDDLDADYEQFTRTLSDKLWTYSAEKRYIRKDGREIWVNQTLSVVREPSGLPGYFVCVVEDITDRKQAAEALRESENRFRMLVQNASDITMILESDGIIRYESPTVERVLGYTPERRIGTNILDYVHPDDAERASSVIHENYDEGGGRPIVEFRCRHEDGSWRYLEAVSNNMLDEPAMAGIVVNSRDVTDRRQARDALRRSVDALLALYEAGQVLGSTLEPEEIGTRLLRIMQRVSNLDAAVISLLDDEQNLRVWHTIGPESLWRWARESREAETTRDAVLQTGYPRDFRLETSNSADRRRMAGLCLTLVVRDRTVGLLEAYGPRTLLNKNNLEILSSLSIQAASALENARLYGELAERERQLKDLVGRLITAQEEERRHVAYEVHDGLTQIAVAAYQHLQAFAAEHPSDSSGDSGMLDRSLELIRQTVQEARHVIADLRPTALDDFGLATAVRLQVEALRKEDWRIEYRSDLEGERLPLEIETALYRVTQEALTNVRKHAQTTRVDIELERLDDAIRLQVRDQGKGFDSTASFDGGPGERVGLSSMRERIELVGGILQIQSKEGVGSSVTASVPLPEPAKGLQEMARNS